MKYVNLGSLILGAFISTSALAAKSVSIGSIYQEGSKAAVVRITHPGLKCATSKGPIQDVLIPNNMGGIFAMEGPANSSAHVFLAGYDSETESVRVEFTTDASEKSVYRILVEKWLTAGAKDIELPKIVCVPK